MAGANRDWLSAWEQYSTEAEEYLELEDERVLVLVGFRGRGVTRFVVYWDPERALADAGLEPRGEAR